MAQVDLTQDEIKVILSVFANHNHLMLGDAVKMLPIYDKLSKEVLPVDGELSVEN